MFKLKFLKYKALNKGSVVLQMSFAQDTSLSGVAGLFQFSPSFHSISISGTRCHLL